MGNNVRKKKLFEVQKPVEAPVIDISDLDNRTVYMLGLPGHRTAMNRSGLGYLATQAEWAYMRGLMLRWMITGKFKTRNLVFIIFLSFIGIINACPILLLFAGKEARQLFFSNFLIFAPYTLIGILILVNVILGLIRFKEGKDITGG